MSNYPFNDEPPRRVIVIGKGKPGNLRGELVRLKRIAALKRTNLTDTSGSPSESRCSESHLENILAVRGEREAAEARATVRAVKEQQ